MPIGDPERGSRERQASVRARRATSSTGVWTLVKIKKGEKEWLLIKERDGYAAADADAA